MTNTEIDHVVNRVVRMLSERMGAVARTLEAPPKGPGNRFVVLGKPCACGCKITLDTWQQGATWAIEHCPAHAAVAV